MAYTEKEYQQRISLGQSNNALTMLVIVNLILFTALFFIRAYFIFIYRTPGSNEDAVRFNDQILTWMVLPADLPTLAQRPWTILTSMFVETGVWSILANMLWLWTFGYIMQDLTGNKKIIPVFLYGGILGGIGFIAAYNLIPSLQAAAPVTTSYGAYAGVTAVAVATTMVAPQYRIFPLFNGGFPLWILTGIYLVVSLATVPSYSIPGYVPHIAGAFMGVLFILMVRAGHDWSEWMNNAYDWVSNLFNPDKKKNKVDIKEELFYKSANPPYKRTPNVTQQRIDEILDKISQKGYGYLTEEEKELLKRASQEDFSG
jgi:membrane associated rhomboid family serine protease